MELRVNMRKLSDYSEEEIDAVFEAYKFPRAPFSDQDQLHLMRSYTGSRVVLNMRIRALGRSILEALRIRDRGTTTPQDKDHGAPRVLTGAEAELFKAVSDIVFSDSSGAVKANRLMQIIDKYAVQERLSELKRHSYGKGGVSAYSINQRIAELTNQLEGKE